MGRSCLICKSNYSNVKNNSLFKVPADSDMLKLWQAAIPGEVELKKSDFICKKHFEEKYIISKYIKHDANGKVIAEVPFKHCRLDASAIPTIFDECTMEQVQAVHELENQNPELINIASNETPIGNKLCLPSVQCKNTSNQHPVTRTLDDTKRKKPRLDSITVGSSMDNNISANQQSSPRKDGRVQVTVSVPDSASDKPFHLSTAIYEKLCTMEEELEPVHNRQTNAVEGQKKHSAIVVPKFWSVGELQQISGQKLLFTHARVITRNGAESPITVKSVTLNSDKILQYHVYGSVINSAEAKLVEKIDTIEEIPTILENFGKMNVCCGIGPVNMHHVVFDLVFQDYFELWHHKDCSLVSKTKRCVNCFKLRKVQLQKEARFERYTKLHRISTSLNPIATNKSTVMRKRNNIERRKKNRAKLRTALLLKSREDSKEATS